VVQNCRLGVLGKMKRSEILGQTYIMYYEKNSLNERERYHEVNHSYSKELHY
jgi:hypothetical protein